MEGVIQDALGGGQYNIKVDQGGAIVRAQLSGRMRRHHIRVLPGESRASRCFSLRSVARSDRLSRQVTGGRALGRRCLPVLLALACSRAPEPNDHERASAPASSAAPETSLAPVAPVPARPELLYLPDGGDVVQSGSAPELLPGLPPVSTRCPLDMVDVRGRFCIDRYEVTLVDQKQGRQLSPYYHPTRVQPRPPSRIGHGALPCRGSLRRRHPSFSYRRTSSPRAESRASVTPSGYLSGNLADLACRNAGKRLCTIEEWVLACRGEGGHKFPYGDHYEEGRCNVFRETHPAQVLHGDMSIGHLDPRLNLVEAPSGPLLRKTGATTSCKSAWGGDAAFDMVGNLDEWVNAPVGAFVGGFYARSTREGCDSKVSSHPRSYFDYSLGTRCCR